MVNGIVEKKSSIELFFLIGITTIYINKQKNGMEKNGWVKKSGGR